MSEKKLPAKQVGSYARQNAQGFIEIICESTGNILAIQETVGEVEPSEFYETKDASGRVVMLQRGVSSDSIPQRSPYPYSQVIADIVCQNVAEGKTLLEICSEKGMPSYSILCKWRRENKDFMGAIEDARRDRAENFHDKIIKEAEDADSSTMQEAKVRIDAYKWAAGVGDADKFGSKTKVVGDKDNPITFVIDTGIRRPEDYNKDEALASREVVEKGDDSGTTKPKALNAGASSSDNDIGDSEKVISGPSDISVGEDRSSGDEY